MDYLELPPPPPLGHVVHRFWFLRGDGAGEPQTIVPDGRVEVVLHLGEPFAQIDETGRPRPQPRAIAAGQLTAPLRLLPRSGAEVVGIRLRTSAARRLLRVPQRELTGRVVPLGHVVPLLERRLLAAVRPAVDLRVRAERLAGALANLLADERPTPVDAAVARLESGRPGNVPALAAAVGLTPRTLQRRFLEEVGMDPSLLRRIFRFRTAFGLLEGPHRRFAGAPPSAFFGSGPELARAFSGSPATE